MCRLIFRRTGVGDRDSPEPGGSEARGATMRIHVSGFVAHFIRDARIVLDDERYRALGSSLFCDDGDPRGGDPVGNDGDETGRGNNSKHCIRGRK